MQHVSAARNPHEPHFTLKEVAKEWRVDEETVRQMFIDEEGVLIFGEQDRRDGKRVYLTMRIPESVLNRVYAARTMRKFQAPKNHGWKIRRTNGNSQGPQPGKTE